MKLSPSSLKAYLSCERSWWLRYVARVSEYSGGAYLQKGRDYDEAVQAYVHGRPGTTELAARQLVATRRHLPRENALTQVKLSYDLGEGDTLQGTTDIIVADTSRVLVIDTKTTADFQYALTTETMLLDPQVLIYAFLACVTYDVQTATMRWVYADKKSNPRGWAVEVEVSRATGAAYVEDVVRPAVARMKQLEEADEQNEAAVEYRSCARCWVVQHCNWHLGRTERPVLGRHLDVIA
jgi:CRISPR/Cas system-associated exonuclease Cas4 (RecB family)